MRFVVYKHSLVLGDNNIVTKQFIVLSHTENLEILAETQGQARRNPGQKHQQIQQGGEGPLPVSLLHAVLRQVIRFV